MVVIVIVIVICIIVLHLHLLSLLLQSLHYTTGKTILELGGNNAMIIDGSAAIDSTGKSDVLDMAVRATLFGAVGTAGKCSVV